MATIIQKENIQTHVIDRYSFRVLQQKDSEVQKDTHSNVAREATQQIPKDESIDSSALSSDSKDSLIESLMKKTDEMSSNFIKLQMKLEDKEREFEEKLKQTKEQSYQDGFEAAKEQTAKELQNDYEEIKRQFLISVEKLEQEAKKFEKSLNGIKDELVGAAVDIAHEVIKIELSQNSSDVVKKLSDELLEDLKSASHVTLKVNPKDHGVISEHVGKLEHVDVVSDSAVSEGGVVALSEAGNIDAQIQKRFERVKKAALNG